MRGTVRSPDPSKPERDQVPIRVDIDVPEQVRADRRLEVMPRNVYFRKSDFEKSGYTDNCKGCMNIRTGWGEQVTLKSVQKSYGRGTGQD